MKHLGNDEQLIFINQLKYIYGKGDGKRVIIVKNRNLEVWLSLDNALDILRASYYGYNLSFLSKNGFGNNTGKFEKDFEGGFLYTCGLDNLNNCVEGLPVHGSFHSFQCSEYNCITENGKAIVTAVIEDSALFKQKLKVKRKVTVDCDGISVTDEIINGGFKEEEYAILYHINWGYPMLDENCRLVLDKSESSGLNGFAEEDIENALKITEPQDNLAERCYYHKLNKGFVRLENGKIGITAELNFDLKELPYFIEWKSMGSGDYALGTEPSTSTFADFTKTKISPSEKHTKRLFIKFIKA